METLERFGGFPMFSGISKSWMAWLVILMVALGAGFAATAKADDATAKDDKKTEKVENKDDKKSAEDTKADDKTHYVKVAPIILPVIGDNGVEQIVSIVAVIQASSKDAADKITDVVPRINDAFITQLYGSMDRRERMKDGLIDVGYLKQKMLDMTQKITGPDKVKDLLIQGVNQRQA